MNVIIIFGATVIIQAITLIVAVHLINRLLKKNYTTNQVIHLQDGMLKNLEATLTATERGDSETAERYLGYFRTRATLVAQLRGDIASGRHAKRTTYDGTSVGQSSGLEN